MSEWTTRLEDATGNEAAWRRLNPTLHCGHGQMKLKAMEPSASYLQLDMGKKKKKAQLTLKYI